MKSSSSALTIASAAVVALAGCANNPETRDSAALRSIDAQLRGSAATKAGERDAKDADALPAAVATAVLPKALPKPVVPKGGKKASGEQRFDLMVKDTPISQVMMGLVEDTPYSILLKPRAAVAHAGAAPAAASAGAAVDLSERVTVNLKNVTVAEVLDSFREVYGYEYTVDGTRIYVQPPELQTRLYHVNYVIGQRRGVSDLQVISGASTGSSSGSSSSGGGASGGASSGGSSSGSSYASVQATGVTSSAKSDLWGEVEDSLRTALGCMIPRKAAATTSQSGARSGSSASGSGGASRADVSSPGDPEFGERARGVDGCTDGRAISVNQMSGTLMVRAMPTEHRTIMQMLRSMQLKVDRQVIIEAKIVDVELNSGSQQGINWSVFQRVGTPVGVSIGGDSTRIGSNGMTINSGATLGEWLGSGLVGTSSPNAFNAGLGVALRVDNFTGLLNFLNTQGHVHVLSSPRIATLNSQKAVIKVGSEEPFVTNIDGGGTNITNGISQTTPPTLRYQPFFSGIALDVTPQIDDKDNITLHVHSMVTSITEKEKISQPTAGAVRVPFAVNTINETDSVVKTRDGQVIVIGGLMTESSQLNKAKVPGFGDILGVGSLFRKDNEATTKRELVILLKPTIVKDDTAWEQDMAATRGRIEHYTAPPVPADGAH